MRTFRILSLPLAVVTVLALAPATLASASAPAPGTSGAPAQGTIPGRYIVTLVDGADPVAVAREYRARGADVDHVYRSALRGFAGAVPVREVDRLRADARVERVEADGWARASELTTQTGATWGLDRIDERELTLDATYTYETTASGVTAYVIDTGIRASHTEFTGRMAPGFTSIDDGHDTDDCNGHGTHVAGTIGGTTNGVAKDVTLVPVRVLNCSGSGTWSGVIAGIDWVTTNARKPAVANMSLGGGASSSVDDAVRRSISSGVVYALAAGNDNRDACNYSPARVLEGLTVGATTSADARSSYSNFGGCLDLFAPGSSITSAWITNDTSTKTISGTSMATPHVAGAAALHLAVNPGATVSEVNDAVVGNGTAGVVSDAGRRSPNVLLHSLFTTTEPTGPTAPTGFDATAVSSSQIDLKWDRNADGSSYVLTLPGGARIALENGVTVYSQAGLTPSTTYQYFLEAVDANGLVSTAVTDTATTFALAEETPATRISLTAIGSKVKGVQQVDLAWSGATSTNLDVLRDGSLVTTTANDGAYLDQLNTKGGGSYTYKVCEAGTATCSAEVTVTF